jgi:hypothetical protein
MRWLEFCAVTRVIAVQPQLPIRGEFRAYVHDEAAEAVVIAPHDVLKNLGLREPINEAQGYDELIGGAAVMGDGASTSSLGSGHAQQTQVQKSPGPVRHDVEFRARILSGAFHRGFCTDKLREVRGDVVL